MNIKLHRNFLKSIFLTALSIVWVITLPQMNFAQLNDLEQPIEWLVLAVGEAERTINANQFDALTTDDFSESQINGTGTTTKSKSQILDELSKTPEGFRKVLSMVRVKTEMSDVSIKHANQYVEFKFLMTERSSLNTAQTEEFKKIERFDITGTAIWRNGMVPGKGSWTLSSLQKKLSVNPDKAQLDGELEARMNFETAMVDLLSNSAEPESPDSANTSLLTAIDPAQTKMIFRRRNVNTAAGFSDVSWFIDLNGKIYRYEIKLADGNTPAPRFEFKTPPILVARLAPELIGEKLALSHKAARGKFTRKYAPRGDSTGISRGETYSAFLVNPLTNKFDEIKLKETGDYTGTNNAPEAALLVEWLETIFKEIAINSLTNSNINKAADGEKQSNTIKMSARSTVNLSDASTGKVP